MSKLFRGISLGGLCLDNRIAVSPMCQYSAVNAVAQDWHLIRLGSLAMSGAGLVIAEATAVEAAGRITHGCLGLWNDEQEDALARIVRAAKAYSRAALGIQLGHAGRHANRSRHVLHASGSIVARARGRPMDRQPSPTMRAGTRLSR
jgi:NADPH2 dehydrogenase